MGGWTGEVGGAGGAGRGLDSNSFALARKTSETLSSRAAAAAAAASSLFLRVL